MVNIVYTLIALSMLIMWFSINEDDDDMDGGKMIPAYQRANK